MILARVIERNPNLSSYQSRLHVDIRLISFPFIGQHLDGSTHFKRPANYEVVFDRVPSYAKGFEKLYSDVWAIRRTGVGDFISPTLANRRSSSAPISCSTRRARARHDRPRNGALIDPNAWTIDQIRYDYYNGGVITMTQHFTARSAATRCSARKPPILKYRTCAP